MPRSISPPLGLAVAAAIALPSAAAEICVICSEPNASYRCAFEGDSAASATDARLALACLSALSEKGGHQRCMIERNGPQPCKGPLHTIARPLEETGGKAGTAAGEAGKGEPGKDGAAQGPAHKAANGPATPEAVPDTSPETHSAKGHESAKKDAPSHPDSEAAPKTVKDMVGQGASKTGKAISTAGEAAGDAAKSGAEKTEGALSKAGSAISNAAKKTWSCISSLFGQC